jgi:flagellar basal-body rod protein FlgF
MSAGLQAASSSMMLDIERLASTSRNLANVGTVGYKREIARSVPFEQLMSAASQDVRDQVQLVRDFKAGPIRETGNPLDVALDGDGFLVVSTSDGEALTRSASLRLQGDGRLVTQAGWPVQSDAGDLRINFANPRIDAQGRVFDGDRLVAQLKLVKPDRNENLVFTGGGLYVAKEASTLKPAEGVGVRQGYLEMSNVESAQEMVRLLETVRHFEAGQKLVQGMDEMMDRALKKLGEF